MTDRETGQEPDEFYVPTPEELERGIGPAARKRRKSRPEETRGRGRLTELARRLFRLRPGVGRERTEAPAPTPPPTTPDPSSPPPSTHSSSRGEAGPGPVPQSPPSGHPQSTTGQTSDPEPTIGDPDKPVATPPPPSSTTSEQRLRRVVIPERATRPTEERAANRHVPKWVLEEASKASARGHELRGFREQRRALASEQERSFVSECITCGAKASVTLAVHDNWTAREGGYRSPKGKAFEKDCSPGVG